MTTQGLLYLTAFAVGVFGMFLLVYGNWRGMRLEGDPWLSGPRMWGVLLTALGFVMSLIPSVL
ncbi:hypothetical protein ACFZA2_17150 [Microbacterium sp. NPDC007973]|uniref:hypothetical protein n=1 Tax=Microbacterium sp. NPDC007973 TaxID=3364182 RepID=UPI0036E376BB